MPANREKITEFLLQLDGWNQDRYGNIVKRTKDKLFRYKFNKRTFRVELKWSYKGQTWRNKYHGHPLYYSNTIVFDDKIICITNQEFERLQTLYI